jgi:hypothetical protein
MASTPAHRPTRRAACVAGLSWLAAAGLAHAETALDTLATMVRFLGAAASLLAGTAVRVERLGLSGLPPLEREAAQAQLMELTRALDFMLPRQQVFIGDLRSYLETARAERFDSPAQRERVWRAAVADVDEISAAAGRVQAVVARPGTRLEVALPDEDRLALQSALQERQTLLARLKALPPPGTPGELAQLEQLTERYTRLRRAAFDLRVALQGQLGERLPP